MQNACREKYHFLGFFILLKCSRNLSKFTLSLANILHTTTFHNMLERKITSLERQSKSVLFTIENCLPLTVQ